MTHPNTDSREQGYKLCDCDGFWHISVKDSQDGWHTVYIDEASLTDYTANKQKEVLEWVEQEVVGADEYPKNSERNVNYKRTDEVKARDKLRATQREQLKNKRKEL